MNRSFCAHCFDVYLMVPFGFGGIENMRTECAGLPDSWVALAWMDMLPDFLEDRAALYVSGALDAAERENFELVLEFNEELRNRVSELSNAITACALIAAGSAGMPSQGLKARIFSRLGGGDTYADVDALVVTDVDGRVQWVNEAFTALCGYTLVELKGRKPGQLLQGAETDFAAVERIRIALRKTQSIRETLVNYHKDGSRYVVDIKIVPILDDAGHPRWLVARERRVPDEASVILG